jgi:hypothetical protein
MRALELEALEIGDVKERKSASSFVWYQIYIHFLLFEFVEKVDNLLTHNSGTTRDMPDCSFSSWAMGVS